MTNHKLQQAPPAEDNLPSPHPTSRPSGPRQPLNTPIPIREASREPAGVGKQTTHLHSATINVKLVCFTGGIKLPAILYTMRLRRRHQDHGAKPVVPPEVPASDLFCKSWLPCPPSSQALAPIPQSKSQNKETISAKYAALLFLSVGSDSFPWGSPRLSPLASPGSASSNHWMLPSPPWR